MILIDGIPGNEIKVADRGLHYGDGLFETVAVSSGIPALWQRHLDRLRRGCERLSIDMPDSKTLWGEAERLCAGAERAVLKLIVTRGIGGRGYRLPVQPRSTRILSLHPWPDHPEAWWNDGVVVRVCRHRLPIHAALAGIKHLNRLDQVMARMEWEDAAIAEGLLLDPLGRVIEGTMTNVFLVRGGCLLTPDLKESGIEGVMRALIMDTAVDLGIPCVVTALTLTDCFEADELFLCNSVIGIWPVCRLQTKVFAAPGSMTGHLSRAIRI